MPGANAVRAAVIDLRRVRLRLLTLALLSFLAAAASISCAAAQNIQIADMLPPPDAAMVQYRRALDDYNRAWQSHVAASNAYWNLISEKRRLRNSKRARGESLTISDYVLAQPPVYTGPPKPRNPVEPEIPPSRPYVPVVADFVTAARQEFRFTPRFPQNENEFKHAYAKVALAAGLTRDQIVRIYGFEATGNGSYDIEAGLEYNKQGRAITTALGYNQLLATNSVEILAEKGSEFIARFAGRTAAKSGAEHQSLDGKIDVLRRMVAFARS